MTNVAGFMLSVIQDVREVKVGATYLIEWRKPGEKKPDVNAPMEPTICKCFAVSPLFRFTKLEGGKESMFSLGKTTMARLLFEKRISIYASTLSDEDLYEELKATLGDMGKLKKERPAKLKRKGTFDVW
jgi:hypothetical protein